MSKTDDTKSAEIHLSYFKQGDDLAHHLQEKPDDPLTGHIDQMQSVVDHLRQLKAEIGDAKVEFEAGTHYICVTGPTELIDRLVAKELAVIHDYEDEDFDDEDDGEDLDDLEEDEDEEAQG